MDQRMRKVGAAMASGVLLGCLLTAISGCSNGLASSQKVDKELSAIGKTRQTVFPFAGKVLVDGLPPPVERLRETNRRGAVQSGRTERPGHPPTAGRVQSKWGIHVHNVRAERWRSTGRLRGDDCAIVERKGPHLFGS